MNRVSFSKMTVGQLVQYAKSLRMDEGDIFARETGKPYAKKDLQENIREKLSENALDRYL